MSIRRGAFLLFEGVDRCGKTTQARALVDALTASGARAVIMRFPDRDTAIGALINAYLAGSTELDDHAVHLLFSANRWEKRAAILSALREGVHVVCDRYALSGVAFSAAKPGLDINWCAEPDAGLPAPDVVLFMDLPPAAAELRGGFGGERYEVPEFQRRVRAAFSALETRTNGGGVESGGALDKLPWVTVDASGSVAEVAGRVRVVVDPIIASAIAGSLPLRTLWDNAPL